jgi:hypothetical protein
MRKGELGGGRSRSSDLVATMGVRYRMSIMLMRSCLCSLSFMFNKANLSFVSSLCVSKGGFGGF